MKIKFKAPKGSKPAEIGFGGGGDNPFRTTIDPGQSVEVPAEHVEEAQALVEGPNVLFVEEESG